MKTKLLPLFVAVLVLASACSTQEPGSSERNLVSVRATLKGISDPNGRTTELPAPSKAFISIENDNGGIVHDLKELAVVNFNGEWVTEQLELGVGNYRVTRFVLTDETNTVIYACPVASSALADLVDHPLPVDFSVTSSESVVEMEVIAATGIAPTDLGYTSFPIKLTKVTAVLLPEFSEEILKIEYHLSNGESEYRFENDFTGSLLDFNNAALLGQVWNTRIYIWPKFSSTECYPRVFRFKGQIMFDGSVVALPSLNDISWVEMFITEKENFKIFRSVDPTSQLHLEVRVPNEYPQAYGTLDYRRYSFANSSDEWECSDFVELYTVSGIIDAVLNTTKCGAGKNTYEIDSYFVIRLQPNQDQVFTDYYHWNVEDNFVNYCP